MTHRPILPALVLALAVPALTFVGGGGAAASGLVERAEYWGQLHGAGIYCRQQDTDAFGQRAVDYLRRQAASTSEFEAARDRYGVAAIRASQSHPSSAVGGSCAAAVERYREAMGLFRGR